MPQFTLNCQFCHNLTQGERPMRASPVSGSCFSEFVAARVAKYPTLAILFGSGTTGRRTGKVPTLTGI